MNRLLAFGVCVLLTVGQAMAQQKPQYTQYTLNNYLLNPALTGIEDYADVKLGTRHQWSGLEGAPESYYLTVQMPLNKDMSSSYRGVSNSGERPKEATTKKTNIYRRVRPHHGLGGMAMSTRTGPLKRGTFSLSYAYHQPITRNLRIAAGVAPGIIQYSLDPSYVTTAKTNDPAVVDGRVNEVKFDLNMGIWLYSEQFYVGMSGAQLVPSKRDLIYTGSAENNKGELQKHYFVTGGYRFDLTPDVTLVPSVMVKMAQPSPVSVDATVKALFNSRLWVAATYRHQESVAAMAGLNISPLLDLAYSYDAGTSALGSTHAGSHEVVLGFKIRNTRKVICPRWAW
ncbi:type IX secretion system membrane protein PorP/SprF [Pontibacter sp. E15-1]|uniref:PorP/SprF family type IX secretion system membrane protein n=1 Tax=Pontibacter sp. E15-1 TaxID=2919918 RepID=UPI001F4FF4CC|nr:type IX secretion system membrane protein PorP/SprF [Pontibacter sp. E15-1]MCJ8166720.1 type IX secretion system membrane protein PorP/SprF [Pontibacter sp. E15-1]